MTWITPTIAGIAAAVAVPTLVILYFLKLRRRDVEISTTLLWKKTIQDIQANAPFQRLRKNILLLLQLLVLAGILLAIGQPEFSGDALGGTQNVILIDRSASMASMDGDSARPGEVSRLEAAKEQALEIIDSMREPGLIGAGVADEAMIIAFDTTAEVRVQFTSDKAQLRAAVAAVEGSDAPSELAEAVRLARAHLPDMVQVDPTTGENIVMEGIKRGGATIHLLSDGRLPDAEQALTGSEDVINFQQIGQTEAPNVAITALRAERSFDNPRQVSLYVGLINSAHTEQTVDLELRIDGVTLQIASATIPAATPPGGAVGGDEDDADDESANTLAANLPWTPGVTGRTFELDYPEGGIFEAQITPASAETDVLAVDNLAGMVVPPARQLAVAVVSASGNMFLVEALSGLPLAQLVQYTPDEYNAAAGRGEMSQFDVTIFDGWLPTIDGGLGLPPGRHLVLGTVPPPLGFAADVEPANAQMLDWQRDHPVMRLLLLDSLQMLNFREVVVPEESGLDVIAETDRGAALIEITNADTRAIVVPFNVVESTWPFDVSFVIFMGASVQYLGQEGGLFGDSGDTLRPGSVLTDRLPQGAADARIELPGGQTSDLKPAADGRIAFGPIREAGLYVASWSGAATAGDTTAGGRVRRTYAANLLDPLESDVSASPMIRLAAAEVMGQSAEESEATFRLWPWLIVAALAILMLEWFVYNRKVHV